MRCIAWYGRVLIVGFVVRHPQGANQPDFAQELPSCRGFLRRIFRVILQENQQNFVEIMALFEQGKIDPLIGAEFPITDYAAALNCLSQRKAVGKVVVNL